MKKLPFILFPLTVTLLSGCVTTRGYEQMLQSWVGGSERELLESSWGVPDKTFTQTDGSKIYCYKSQHIESTPTTITTSRRHATVWEGSTREFYCETCFYLTPARVIYHYTFKGNSCVAQEINR